MTIQEQSADFQAYVSRRLAEGDPSKLTMDQLYDEWRIENPMADELAENVAAVEAALTDYRNGDTGIPHEQHMREIKKNWDAPADE